MRGSNERRIMGMAVDGAQFCPHASRMQKRACTSDDELAGGACRQSAANDDAFGALPLGQQQETLGERGKGAGKILDRAMHDRARVVILRSEGGIELLLLDRYAFSLSERILAR